MQQAGDALGDFSRQDSGREIIHDLRNLFAVVAAIKELLAKTAVGAGQEKMLRGLEEAALRGDELTSRLLAKEGRGARRLVDVGAQIAQAAPMLQAVIRAPACLEIDAQVALPAALVRADPADLEAVFLELVANAGAAGAGKIMLRCRRIGCRIWIVIADDGPGLLPNGITKAPRMRLAGSRGIGLNRVRRAVQDMNGKFLIRSRADAGGGTVAAIILPVALRAVSKSRARDWSASPQHKESCDEDRRTAAARRHG